MQFLTTVLILASSSASLASVLLPRELLWCGAARYDPKDYTCYPQNNNLLCPITGGVIYQPCGNACFNPANYGCKDGKLVPVGKCNGQVYDKNSYVCVNDHLCPIGYPNLCGEACYKVTEYKCVNGNLQHV